MCFVSVVSFVRQRLRRKTTVVHITFASGVVTESNEKRKIVFTCTNNKRLDVFFACPINSTQRVTIDAFDKINRTRPVRETAVLSRTVSRERQPFTRTSSTLLLSCTPSSGLRSIPSRRHARADLFVSTDGFGDARAKTGFRTVGTCDEDGVRLGEERDSRGSLRALFFLSTLTCSQEKAGSVRSKRDVRYTDTGSMYAYVRNIFFLTL